MRTNDESNGLRLSPARHAFKQEHLETHREWRPLMTVIMSHKDTNERSRRVQLCKQAVLPTITTEEESCKDY